MTYKVSQISKSITVGNLTLLWGVYHDHCLTAAFLSEAEADIFCAIKNVLKKHIG